jgi:cell division protein FtsX
VPAFNLALDWRVAAVALLIAAVAPIVFGVAPAAHALRLATADGLRGQALLIRRRRLFMGPRELLLVTQVIVSCALLMTAALFLRSLAPAAAGEQHAATRLVAVVPIDLNTAARSDAEMSTISDRLLQAANRVPEVEGTTFAAIVPLTGSSIGTVGRLDDRPQEPDISLDANVVAPGYFDLMGIVTRSGRGFDARDRAGAPKVAVVSESLARKLWNTDAVVGRVIRLRDAPTEVVGVVADVPYRSLDGAPQPVVYVPLAQAPRSRLVLHARVGNGGEGLAALDRALRSVDARIITGTAMPLGRYVDESQAPVRIAQRIGGAAGVLQLALALMATWALVAYAVERRTREIAVRRALGATERSVLGLVMRPSLHLLAFGGAIGCGAGILIAQTLHATIGGLAPLALADVVPVAGLIAIVVIAAAWLPARSAASIEPASALKQS